jgi:enamine deaminase RidA (YjgF/YER057c/UK114 family)
LPSGVLCAAQRYDRSGFSALADSVGDIAGDHVEEAVLVTGAGKQIVLADENIKALQREAVLSDVLEDVVVLRSHRVFDHRRGRYRLSLVSDGVPAGSEITPRLRPSTVTVGFFAERLVVGIVRDLEGLSVRVQPP